uniref:Cytochrome P450, family 2, subfamily Y, polypeptide 3 n=1 Tax=Periophthalmus magnuspinnatus TaxID=409849 RepID=A0A3B4AH94_9GOBI
MPFFDSVLLAVLVFVLLWLLSRKQSRQMCLPPGPTGLPLVGNLFQLDRKAPYKSVVKLSESYGPVIMVNTGLQRVVFLIGYDAVKEALVDHADDFIGRGPLPFLVKITRGLVISNGERWRQLRQFTLSTLRDFGMGRKGMEQWIQEESTHLVERIKTMKGEPFDPTFFLSCSVSNIICCLVFGERFSYDDKHFLRLLQHISQILILISSPWAVVRQCHYVNIFQHVLIRSAKETKVKEHEDTLDPNSPRDYIDCFLTRAIKVIFLCLEKGTSTEFHNDNLVSTVFNMYMGGTESTSSTIRFALNVFIKYPKIQGRMQQEIDNVIGQERFPFMEDRKSLPFVDAVLHEVQRFMDFAPLGAPHYALHNITFRGYTIPKGTMIFPVLYSVLKEGKQWATPFLFNPQHFLDHNDNFKKNPAFLPFSAGKRACVGESLARMEIFLFLVKLLQHFTFSCPGGPDSIELTPEFIISGTLTLNAHKCTALWVTYSGSEQSQSHTV